MKITKKWLMGNKACKESLQAWDEANLTEIEAIDLLEKLIAQKKNWATWLVNTLLATGTKTLPAATLEKCGYKIAADGANITVNAGEKYLALSGTQKSVTVNGDGVFEAHGGSRQDAVTVNTDGRFGTFGESRQTSVTVNGGWFRAFGESRQDAVTVNAGGWFESYDGSRQDAVTVNGDGAFEALDNSRQDAVTVNGDGVFRVWGNSKQKKIIRK